MTVPSNRMLPTQPANAMFHQANDAAAQSQSRHLPPLPYSHGSPPPSKLTNTPIDLTSPTRPPKAPIQRERRPDVTRPPPPRPRISDDEKRLVGDYSTPADAIAAPDPLSWFTRSTNSGRAAMNNKPGSNGSFKPINTIHEVNPGADRSRLITYAKQHRPIPPSIGQTRHAGQKAYLAREKDRTPITPARGFASTVEHARRSGRASSVKRRKTEHVIDLDGNDDLYEAHETQQPSPLYTPAGTSNILPPSAKSSQSQPSIRSGSSITKNRKASQTRSEFHEVDSIVNPHRKKARTPSSNRNKDANRLSPFGGGSTVGSVKACASTSPIVVPDDEESKIRNQSARRLILQECQQDKPDSSSEERKRALLKHDTTTSHHFPNAHINESTSEQSVNHRNALSDGANLRARYRRAPSKTTDINDRGSDDELAMSDQNESARKRLKSPSKARQAANSGVKRKVHSGPASKGWPLVFARTHGYEANGSEMVNGPYDLLLRIDSEGYRVVAHDYTADVTVSRVQIRPQDATKGQADDISRIRLEGPRRQDGNIPIFDLEFAERSDLRLFRDKYAVTLIAPGKIFSRLEEHMVTLFSKPLPTNDKVRTSILLHEPMPEADNQIEQMDKNSKVPVWNRMTSIALEPNRTVATNEADGSTTEPMVTNTSTRPSRSTRSSGPTYHLGETVEHRKVHKYSVDVGLGEPWTKPLEYGSGRQRAVVHFNDLPRLDEEEFMNDSLIDFYMIYLFNKINVPLDKVYFFNTYFFTQLTKNTGRQSMNYKAVERWTSKIDVFNYDYIVVPINEQTHWYLAIICNVSNIDRKPLVDDFDEHLARALEESRKDVANQAITEEDKKLDTLQPAPITNTSCDVQREVSKQIDDDPNLFDEVAGLNLVDRDNTGTEEGPQTKDGQTVSLAHSPAAEKRRAVHSVADVETKPKGILHNLSASPIKRKTKRKPTQPKKDPNQPIILILDSLGQTRSGTVRALKDWLAAEGNAKRGMEAVIREKGYYPKASQIPMQNNWSDCGVYLLGYVDKFFQNPDEFKTKLLTGEMSAEEDWPELKPKEMRNSMRDIIVRFAEEQKVARQVEKKAKKGAAKDKTSPDPIAMGPSKSKSKAVQTNQLPAQSDGMQPKLVGTQTKGSEQSESDAIAVLKPKLVSPFSFEPQTAKCSSHLQSVENMGKVSDSPPVATSRVKPASTTPRQEWTPRRWGPEIRIPVKTPGSGSHSSVLNAPTYSVEVAHPGERVRRPESASRSLSPSKRRMEDDQLRLLFAKRQHTGSPEKKKNGRSRPPSPSMPRNREGSENRPISIDDSQEINLVAGPSLKHVRTDWTPQRKPPTRSSRPVPTLRHSPSVEEIDPPAPFAAAEREHGETEKVFVGHELDAKLDEAAREEDRHRWSLARSLTPSAPRFYLNRAEEALFDPMDVDTDDADMMEIDGSTQGSVVRETPEANRRSPDVQTEWVPGDPLPQ